MKARDWKVWQPACIPLVPAGSWNLDALHSVLPDSFFFHSAASFLSVKSATKTIPSTMWNSIPHINDLITVKTNYQPTLKENAEITYPRGEDRYKFTELQRKCASRAVVSSNLMDFEEKV